MKRWLRHFVVRLVLAVMGITVLLLPAGQHIWVLFGLKPFNPITRAHPEFVSAPIPEFLIPLEDYTRHVFIGLPIVLVASLGAILIYLMLGKIAGSNVRVETRCRACRAVLRNLKEPRCPACGEPL